eukprot:gene8218-5742_t
MSRRVYDFVVLGAGPAGLSAARHLALKFPTSRIALVEEGAYNTDLSLLQRVPLLQPLLAITPQKIGASLRCYRSAADRLVAGRQLQLFTGSGVGGSTLVSDMRGVRPTQADCAQWGPGWSWEDLELSLLSTVRCSDDAAPSGSPELPAPLVTVRRANRSVVDAPLNIRFYEACEAAGIPEAASFNRGAANGYSFYESLVTKAYEREVVRPDAELVAKTEGERGIYLFTGRRAEKVLFDETRATGVRCSSDTTLHTERVVVALGAMESPALLLRSGIGGAAGDLVANEAVGANLVTPTSIAVQLTMGTDPSTNAMTFKGPGLRNMRYLRRQWEEYKQCHTGIFSAFCEAAAFLRSCPEVLEPDVSVDFYRHPLCIPGETGVAAWRRRLQPLSFSMQATHYYPKSRGTVTWSAERGVSVAFNIFSDEEGHDVQRMDEALQWIGRLASPSLPSAYYTDEKHQPVSPFYHLKTRMTHPGRSLRNEAEVGAFLQQFVSLNGSAFGTCAMGTVTESNLAVRGVSGLFVADCSIVPQPTVASPWLLSAAIGHRAANFIDNKHQHEQAKRGFVFDRGEMCRLLHPAFFFVPLFSHLLGYGLKYKTEITTEDIIGLKRTLRERSRGCLYGCIPTGTVAFRRDVSPMAASYAEVVQACSEFQENFSVLNAKFNALAEELKHEREMNERSQKRILELEKKEESKTKTITQLQEELEQAAVYKNKYLEANIHLESMKGKMENARRGVGDTILEHEQKVEQLNEQIVDLQKRLATASNSSRVQELQKQVQELEERCAVQNGQLSEEREKCAQQILSAHNALREQQSRNLELEQRVRSMETDMNDMRASLRRSMALQNDAALLKERLASEAASSQLCLEDLRREVSDARSQLEKAREDHDAALSVLRRASEDDKRVLTDRISSLTSSYNRCLADVSAEKNRVAELQREMERRVHLAREENVAEVTALRRGMSLLKEDAQRDKFALQQLQEELDHARTATANEAERCAALQDQQQQLIIKLDAAVQQEAWAASEKRHCEDRLAMLQRHVDELAESSKSVDQLEVEVERLRMAIKFRDEELQQTHRCVHQLESKLRDVEEASAEKIQTAKREARHLRKQLRMEEAKGDSLRKKLLRALVDKEHESHVGRAVGFIPTAPADTAYAAGLPSLATGGAAAGGFDVLDLLRAQPFHNPPFHTTPVLHYRLTWRLQTNPNQPHRDKTKPIEDGRSLWNNPSFSFESLCCANDFEKENIQKKKILPVGAKHNLKPYLSCPPFCVSLARTERFCGRFF